MITAGRSQPAIRAFIGLGGNLDDPAARVRAAIRSLDGIDGCALAARSSLYRTAPVGFADQPDFINAVAAVDTVLTPAALLAALLGLEQGQGRVRSFRNAPRTLDLDLLVYGDQRVTLPQLEVPHPRMHERAFVLVPLAEIAPDLMIPGRGRVCELCAALPPGGIEPLPDR